MITKAMKEGKTIVRFKIPELGSYSVSYNSFKYLPPFHHYTVCERKQYLKEKTKEPKFTVWCNGCGIGGVNNVKEGLKIIGDHAENEIKFCIKKSEAKLEKLLWVNNLIKGTNWIRRFKEK